MHNDYNNGCIHVRMQMFNFMQYLLAKQESVSMLRYRSMLMDNKLEMVTMYGYRSMLIGPEKMDIHVRIQENGPT
jgi:hypothetical protein